ncbi:MAG: hypothetical protein J0H15_12255 [Xanthomonadales bacterium]|nr:hypothetical protein [Xanthomonadales bacterium]
MDNWKVGDAIDHAVHGRGTITFVGTDYVGVRFDDGRDAMLRTGALHAAGADSATAQPADDPQAPAATEWPENTFVADQAAERHSMGSHWKPFAEDAGHIFTRLPEWLPQMDLFRVYGDFFKPRRALPEDWPTGLALCWPDVHGGVVTVLRQGAEANELVSLFPYHERGIQVRLAVDVVHVWEGGLEAQVEASWGEAPIAFYDVGFVSNRGWYEAGQACEFILLGIAYSAGTPKVMSLPFNPHPDQARWLAAIGAEEGESSVAPPQELDLSGMAMLVPVLEWDRDDYQFRGTVKEVQELADVLGQQAWRLVVTVMRLGEENDEDADLAILVTRRAWRDETPPVPGMAVDGTLWLQGRLWQPERGRTGR